MRTSFPAGALAAVCLAAIPTSWLFAQERRAAITIDDLLYVSGRITTATRSQEQAAAMDVNQKLLVALKHHNVPVIGFVIQKRVESLGLPLATGILKTWIDRGFNLGNHTYSHPDINPLSVEEIDREIVGGETTIGPLMKDAGKPSRSSAFR